MGFTTEGLRESSLPVTVADETAQNRGFHLKLEKLLVGDPALGWKCPAKETHGLTGKAFSPRGAFQSLQNTRIILQSAFLVKASESAASHSGAEGDMLRMIPHFVECRNGPSEEFGAHVFGRRGAGLFKITFRVIRFGAGRFKGRPASRIPNRP